MKSTVSKLYLGIFTLAALALTMRTGMVFAQPNSTAVDKTQPAALSSEDAFNLVEEMFDRCTDINTLQCVVQKKERYNGVYTEATSFIKMSTNPYRVYIRQLKPKEGVELIYSETENSGKVLVNPNGFPWFNISLDPYGSMIRDKQHHVIIDMGFSKFNAVLAHLLNKYGQDGEELVAYAGSQKVNGKDCHVVDINNSHYKLVSYTPKANETTSSISEKFKVSEYRIVELNDAVSAYGSVTAGAPITIPNDYAPKIRLFIDVDLKIPIRFEIYDDNFELFEAYQYEDMVINAGFTKDELTPKYPEYGF